MYFCLSNFDNVKFKRTLIFSLSLSPLHRVSYSLFSQVGIFCFRFFVVSFLNKPEEKQ